MNSCRARIISFLILTIDRFGSLRYTLRHGAETVVADSGLGLQFETQAAFDRNLRLVGTAAGGRDDPFHGGR